MVNWKQFYVSFCSGLSRRKNPTFCRSPANALQKLLLCKSFHYNLDFFHDKGALFILFIIFLLTPLQALSKIALW